MSRPRPYILKETNWKSVKDVEFEVAVLPWGATEAHNYHMPYATDNFLGEYVAEKAGEWAWNEGARVVILPCVPFGVNTGQMEINLCLNMNPGTQLALLEDLGQVLLNAGIRKLVILNAHGGNHFKQIIRELSVKLPDLLVCAVDYWKAVDANDYFEEPGDHAGEMETSGMMYIDPDIVLPLEEAGSGAAKELKLTGFKEGWATTQRHWIKTTEDTGVGNPKASSPQKGKVHLEACSRKVGEFLVGLAGTDPEDLYE